MNQPTLSTLSSPRVGKLKEQSGIGENRALLEKRQQLSSEEPKLAVTRKLEGTKVEHQEWKKRHKSQQV